MAGLLVKPEGLGLTPPWMGFASVRSPQLFLSRLGSGSAPLMSTHQQQVTYPCHPCTVATTRGGVGWFFKHFISLPMTEPGTQQVLRKYFFSERVSLANAICIPDLTTQSLLFFFFFKDHIPLRSVGDPHELSSKTLSLRGACLCVEGS